MYFLIEKVKKNRISFRGYGIFRFILAYAKKNLSSLCRNGENSFCFLGFFFKKNFNNKYQKLYKNK